jgi:hypothetical protein
MAPLACVQGHDRQMHAHDILHTALAVLQPQDAVLHIQTVILQNDAKFGEAALLSASL